MTAKGYGFTALTGGGAGALDAIDGSILVAGDFAFGGSAASTLSATFVVVASGAVANGITVITPLVNAGTKRWHLLRDQTKDGTDIYDGTNIGHLQFTANELELYSERHSGVVKVMVEDAAGNKETAIKATGAGAVEAYYDNSKKIETTAVGVTITGGVIQTVPSFARKNHIINGNMILGQRGVSFISTTTPANSDDTYLLDRWILLSDGNDIVDVTQTTTVPTTGFSNSVGLDVETTNKKFGIFQVIENKDSIPLVGSTVTLSFYAKVSATTKLDNIKAAIVSWSSTADTVTSDIVSAWGNEGTAPTLAANWTYENVPANLGVTTSFVKYSISAAIDTASTANIGVFIWSDVTDTTAGDFLYITGVQLELGAYATPFEFRPFSEELALCQRYYEKSYNLSEAPGTNTGNSLGMCAYFSAAVGANYPSTQYTVRKRSVGAVSIYRNDGTAGAIDGGANPAGSAADLGETGFKLDSTFAADTFYKWHWAANAEL